MLVNVSKPVVSSPGFNSNHFISFHFISQVVEVPNVSWEDIGGLENVKRELQEVKIVITSFAWIQNCFIFLELI